MTDITKCDGKHCKDKEQCYRFTAPDDEYGWQSYAEFDAIRTENECDNFWNNERWGK